MKIKTGTTRIVFLVNDKAIKIGRIRLVRFILRIFFISIYAKSKNKLFYNAYGKYRLFGMMKYLSVGINANKKEYQYYKETKDSKVAPTFSIFFWMDYYTKERIKSFQSRAF